MKMRTGFISNSSSCSFIINRHSVSDEKIEQIKQYVHCGEPLKNARKAQPDALDAEMIFGSIMITAGKLK
jgi:hypothetical protein